MVSAAMSGNVDTHQIWLEFGDRLRAFIVRRVRSEADAEDILQEVFLRIHKNVADVNNADRLTSWLFQVTRNAIVDYYRAPARREQVESVAGVAADDWPAPPDLAMEPDDDGARVRSELASCLRPIVAHLPPVYREAVVLVDLDGVTQIEAATRHGISTSGMKSRVQRGRRALKGLLVECCPVHLDAGGRIVDFDRPGSGCQACSGADDGAAPTEERGYERSPCCSR